MEKESTHFHEHLLRSTNLLLENTRKQIVMILLVFKTNLLFSELFENKMNVLILFFTH